MTVGLSDAADRPAKIAGNLPVVQDPRLNGASVGFHVGIQKILPAANAAPVRAENRVLPLADRSCEYGPPARPSGVAVAAAPRRGPAPARFACLPTPLPADPSRRTAHQAPPDRCTASAVVGP